MAISLDLATTDVGIAVNGAYGKVALLRVDPQQTLVQVVFYGSAAARHANAQPLSNTTLFAPTADLTGDIYPAVYAWLKAQDQFANAQDC
jgi:hypothetical protein